MYELPTSFVCKLSTVSLYRQHLMSSRGCVVLKQSLRFSFFSDSPVLLLCKISWKYHVLYCHIFIAVLVPLLKTGYEPDIKFGVFILSSNFCCLLITFANSLDPDQDQQNVGPDLDPNCLTDTLGVVLKEFFKREKFEKIQQTTIKA